MIKRIILSLISIFAFVLFSCNGILNDVEEEQSSSNKAYVRIGDASSRTVLPANLTAADMTDIKLVGEKDGESKELLSAATYSKLSGQSAEIEAGTWSFTLSATINGATFSDSTSCKNVEVSAGQTLSLTFSAMETSATTGGFTVTVNFEGNAKAVAVLFGGEELSGNEVVLTNNTVTVSKDGIAPDDYPIQIKFYADEAKKLCLNTFSELVRIEAGHKSEATYNISLNDEVRYLVMFKSNGGTEVASQKIESGKTATEPTAPTKVGYTFAGWFNGESVFDFETAITENITLTAKWTLITYTITYEGLNGAANPNTATSYTVESETITLQDFSHDDYTFEGWFDAETGGNKVTSIPKGSTGNKTLYAHCTWKWIGTKNPTTAKAVGDIVFSDGSATAYTSELTLTDEQKSKAVAVIFYVGTECSNDSASRTLGVGLQNATGDGNTLEWAPYNTTGYTTNFTDIQCTRSETAQLTARRITLTHIQTRPTMSRAILTAATTGKKYARLTIRQAQTRRQTTLRSTG